jgi:hypothetical protein
MGNYPKPVRKRGGCKVSWFVYAEKTAAEQAAEVARKEARRLDVLGYDFGYQAPGRITTTPDGLFEVCIP